MKRLIALFLFLLPAASAADTPNVITDIAPVHSLTARVMSGVGQPDLLLAPNVSPHEYALRPSDALNLEAADVVIWIGPELTPWLEQPVASLAAGAHKLTLSTVQGVETRQYRELSGDSAVHHEEHEAAEHDDHHDHAVGSLDPHMWLDPDNAILWLHTIAELLAEADPENAKTYQANAQQGAAELSATRDQIATALQGKITNRFLVYHDAYQYFEHRFGLQAWGAVAKGDAHAPGAGRISELRHAIADGRVDCLFTEPQYSASVVDVLAEGNDFRVATLDPLGATLDLGETLYPRMLAQLGNSIAACLSDE